MNQEENHLRYSKNFPEFCIFFFFFGSCKWKHKIIKGRRGHSNWNRAILVVPSNDTSEHAALTQVHIDGKASRMKTVRISKGMKNFVRIRPS